MADRVEKVTTVQEQPTATTRDTRVTESTNARVGGAVLAARIIAYITTALIVLLAIRLLLVLLGANPNNGFADFIYDFSHPFVSPFFGLFGYDLSYGVSKFETYTLVAIVVYAVVGYGLARLMTIGKPNRDAAV